MADNFVGSNYTCDLQNMTDIARSIEDRERTPWLHEKRGREVRFRDGFEMWGVRRRVVVDALMVGWGLGAWLGVNGLYVQMPLLVERLPEGWKLASAMVLAVQLANVGPLAYAALRRLRPATSDAVYIHGLLALGCLALLLNAFLYERTVEFAGASRSLPFLALTFCSALVGCTGAVLFYPHLRHYREVYLATYLAGEGLGGLLPAALALVQGVGGDPHCDAELKAHSPPPLFSTTAFVSVLAALAALSLGSFAVLHASDSFSSERVTEAAADKDEEAGAVSVRGWRWAGALSLTALLSAVGNGLLPAVQPFSCKPYGARTYHLSVVLSAMANPAACLTGVWAPRAPGRVLAALLSLTVPPTAYAVYTALQSPTPPLQDSLLGIVLVVSSWTLATGGVAYCRLWTLGWARRGGARGMRAAGAATQLGSATGSVLLYVLVQYARLFAESPRCLTPT